MKEFNRRQQIIIKIIESMTENYDFTYDTAATELAKTATETKEELLRVWNNYRNLYGEVY